MSAHPIIQPRIEGRTVFTPEGWAEILRRAGQFPEEGGGILIFAEINSTCNFLTGRIVSISHKERLTLRRALQRFRKNQPACGATPADQSA